MPSAALPSTAFDLAVLRGKELFNTAIGPEGTNDNALKPAGRMSDFGWGKLLRLPSRGLADGVTGCSATARARRCRWRAPLRTRKRRWRALMLTGTSAAAVGVLPAGAAARGARRDPGLRAQHSQCLWGPGGSSPLPMRPSRAAAARSIPRVQPALRGECRLPGRTRHRGRDHAPAATRTSTSSPPTCVRHSCAGAGRQGRDPDVLA